MASVTHDNDNNGSADAVDVLSYDSAGRLTGTQYTYSGDGTPDLFVRMGTAPQFSAYQIDSSGRMTQATINNGTSTTVFAFSFGGSLLAQQASISGAGIPAGTSRSYTYSGGLRSKADTFIGGSLVSSETYSHDAAGRRTGKTETIGGASATSTYVWNGSGQLVEVRYPADAEGSNPRYVLSYDSSGRQASTVKTVNGQARYTVTYVHDAQGRLTQARFDNGSNGSIDAVWTYTWQDGPCVGITFPEWDPLSNSISGYGTSANGLYSSCAP